MSVWASSTARSHRCPAGAPWRMLSMRHSIGHRPPLDTFARGSKRVPHFRCYASPPPTEICAPQRLSRLLIAACLAYIWIVYLGSVCERDGWISIIHRRKRCDLSLFQLGMRLLEYILNEELSIPVQFHVTI
jgi:hypothetical protein